MIEIGDLGHVDEHNRLRTVHHVDRYDGIQQAIDAAGNAGGGTVWLPNGDYHFEALTITDDHVTLVGESLEGVRLYHDGDGIAIDVTAQQDVHLANFRLTADGGTHGVVIGAETSTTGTGYELVHLTVEGFSTAAVHAANIELSRFYRVIARQSGIGFLVDNSRHTASRQGISNVFELCRAMSNTGRGFDVGNQTASTFHNCQSLTNGGDWQFALRGTSIACRLLGMDIEDDEGRDGLSVGGSDHVVEGGHFGDLGEAIALRTAARCVVGPLIANAEVSTVLRLDAASADNIVMAMGAYSERISDLAADTVFI